MTLALPLRRSLSRALPLAAVAGALLLAGPATGSASAATKHAPCPTTGKTLAKDVFPNVRVWRQGTTLKACTREPGQRRYVRTLGVWTSGTKIAIGDGNVAWTSTGQTDGGELVDAIATVDVRKGKRWFSTARAALTPDAATPLTDDRVLRLITTYTGTAWVTARGVVNLAARRLDPDAVADDGGTPPPFHQGSRFFLGDAGPSGAAAAAKGIRLTVGGEHDDCGGSDEFKVLVPAIGGQPELGFVYDTRDAVADPDICR
ncbi:hypothetical protein AB0L40_21820 [Patulibacter sp. NPDC049589]|uniref:hypothetical protein n=1 Tax=Patulibacter sp. NPDC049589 TaxID=3154731 RepID=UPI00343EC71A